MSWLSGYSKKPVASTSQAEDRETKRKKLEQEKEERLLRAKQRADRQKQLQLAITAQQEADEALKALLDIDPEINGWATAIIFMCASGAMKRLPFLPHLFAQSKTL